MKRQQMYSVETNDGTEFQIGESLTFEENGENKIQLPNSVFFRIKEEEGDDFVYTFISKEEARKIALLLMTWAK
jgi:hypothetical protein